VVSNADPGDVLPRPDPSKLTTEQLLRELGALKEIVFTRLEGMDRAIILANDRITRQPTEADQKVSHLKDLLGTRLDGMDNLNRERLGSLQQQFAERDIRAATTARDGKLAIDAALQAAKEAVGKSEIATVKQIDQIGVLIEQQRRASDTTLGDIKARLTLIEGRGSGLKDGWGYIVGGIGIVLSMGAVLIAFLALHKGP
jgi:hypothetical protein